MNWLLDTNVVSELMRPGGAPKVVAWLSGMQKLTVSVITVEEIFCGLAYKNAQQQLSWFEKLIELRCNVLPIDERTARMAGILRGELRKKGITRTQADLLIAATSIENDLILATRNTRDFTDCGLILHNPFL